MISFRSLAVLVTASLLLCASAAFAAPAAAPNVVVITIDTLRADHIGCYGYKQIHTPNIDALAAAGTRYDRAYTAVPVTLPSHTVMFTGTYPMLSGMHDFAANKLGPGQPTLASVLKEHGYATAAVIGSAVLPARRGRDRTGHPARTAPPGLRARERSSHPQTIPEAAQRIPHAGFDGRQIRRQPL